MFNTEELKEIKDFIRNSSEDSSIYIGTDSKRQKNKKTRYATVVVIHYGSNNGAKVFGNITLEKDIKEKLNRPFVRLMTEIRKSCEVYIELSDLIGRKIEIHADINPKLIHGSSIAYKAAIDEIFYLTGVFPKFKPEAYAATFAADKVLQLSK